MKTMLTSVVAFAAVAGLAPALAEAQPKRHGHMGMPTTRAEVAQKTQRHFAKVDANRDGFVSQEEAEAAANVRHDRISERMDERGSQMFERFDSNKDGTVTRAEAEAVFATKSVDIVHAGPDDRKPKRNWDALSARFDSNNDGSISRAEFEAGHAKRTERVAHRRSDHGMGAAMFTTADANKDGKVSLDEATAAATAHFDRIDANRDGTISPDEMRAARKAMHSKPAAS